MSDSKISFPPTGRDADGFEVLPAVQRGSTRRLAIFNIFNALLIPAGTGCLGFQQAHAGAASTSLQGKARKRVSVEDFGGSPASSDNSVAFGRIAAAGLAAYCQPGQTYRTAAIVPPASGQFGLYSDGQGATIKLADGASDYLINNESATVCLKNIHLDGNRQQNNVGSLKPAAVLNRLGSFYMFGGSIKNALHDCIRSGNREDGVFDNARYAQIVHMENVFVDGGLRADTSLDRVAPQDCFRIFQTRTVRLINCNSKGGLSGARLGYYNGDTQVLGGHYRDSFGDCGVTIYFTTRWVCRGVTSTGHFQHGFEIDACNNGVLEDYVSEGNARNGILLTEYGPPAAGPRYAGTYDDVTTVYGQLYPCRGVLIGKGSVRRNGLSGIKTIGQGSGVTIRGAHIEDNNTSGSTTENCALFTDGGRLNEDGITISAITAVDTGAGNQKYFRRSSNNQYRTFSTGGHRISGMLHHEFATRGLQTMLARGMLADTSRWGGAATTMVPDALAAPPLSARRIVDASTTDSAIVWCTIPAQSAGDKIIEIMLRTPDTMTTCTIDVSVYRNRAAVGASVFNSAQTLTAAYKAVQVEIPDSIGARNYDAIRVTFTTDPKLEGSVDIGQLDAYGTWEQ